MYLLSRKIKAMGVKMVLSGEGSDEILGGSACPLPTYKIADKMVIRLSVFPRSAGFEVLPPGMH